VHQENHRRAGPDDRCHRSGRRKPRPSSERG
ncbi:MAG: hypothetical protein AVDCRST_MAG44-1149, partial [uncultured Sphingomonas sp.]